jgi:hypothetical protein
MRSVHAGAPPGKGGADPPRTEPIKVVLDRLERGGYDPRKLGSGKYESRCPGHKGTRRNLSIGEGSDGAVLLHCHHADEGGRNCPASAIVAELGLEMRDLFPGVSEPKKTSPKGSKGSREGFGSADDAAEFQARKLKAKITGKWVYQTADGKPYAVVCRFDGPDGKTYRPVSLDPATGRWSFKDPSQWLPYRAEGLATAARVYILEGEKCVEIARGLGLTATTTAHGAQSPHKTDLSALAGKDLVIVPDVGAPGEAYVAALKALLAQLEPRPTVRVLRLPGLTAEGDDIEQWAATSTDGAALAAELERLASALPAEEFVEVKPSVGGEDEDEGEVLDRWPKINPRAFHGIAGEFVGLTDPHTEADPVAILLQFLAAFGNMIGRSAHFLVGATRHHLNLFLWLVGATAAGRKGSSLDVVQWWLRQIDPDWADKRIQGGLVSGEGLIYHVRDALVERREVKEAKGKGKGKGQSNGNGHADDKEIWGMVVGGKRFEDVVTDAGVDDKRLLVTETEMGRTLKAMNRETNTLSDVIRQAWDTGSLRILAKNRPAMATGAHISIICHSTPADVRRHLTQTDSANGFANRFLWAGVRRSKALPDGGALDSVDWGDVKERVRLAAENAKLVGKMSRDRVASEMWRGVYEELSAGNPGMVGMVTGRAVPQTLRLSCLYALLDNSPTVRPEHLTAALALWQFCEDSARMIFGESQGNPDKDKVLAALRQSQGGLTQTQISTDVFNRNKKSKAIRELLSDLLTDRLIHSKAEPTGGRSAVRWFIGRTPAT